MPYSSGAVATVSAMPVPSASRFSAGSYRLSSSLSSPSYYTSEYRSKYSTPSSSTSSVAAYGRRHLSLSEADSGLGASSRYSSASGSSFSLSSSSSRERSEAREPAYSRASSRSRADSGATSASASASAGSSAGVSGGRAARSSTAAALDAVQDLYNKYSPSAYLAERPPRATAASTTAQRYAPAAAVTRTEVIGREQSPASSSSASSSSASSDDEAAAAAGAGPAAPGAAGAASGGGDEPGAVSEVRRRLDSVVSASPSPPPQGAAPAAAVPAPTVSVIQQNGTRVRRRILVTPGPDVGDEGDGERPAAAEAAAAAADGSGASPSRVAKAKSRVDSSDEESSDEEARDRVVAGAARLGTVRRRPPSQAASASSAGSAARFDGQPEISASPRLLRGYSRTPGNERGGLAGLRNIGNTCFMNSVIQCLSNTKPLLEYLLNDGHLPDINTTVSGMKGALIKAFTTVIQELWHSDSNGTVVNTTALKSQIQRFAPRFMGYSQQDAQEFLRYLLEGLHEDVNRVTVKPKPILTEIDETLSDQQKSAEAWKRYLRADDSKIVDIFVGQLKSTLRCTVCGHCSVTFDPFWDLSLPIPVRTGQVRLQQCLDSFTREEVLDGDEKPTCSKCQMRRKCTKSFTIQKFPKILVLHLKRFSPTERFRGKLNVTVDFPLTGLDLSAYAANRGQGCTYNLYGVANHSGTTYSGHYTAYCKHPYTGEWHEYNDSRVSTISSRSIMSSEAYVLFYELFGHTSHL
ncbi:ubiquitin carboxyl-terminal hydrolase 21-like isoform X2 [Schistocerca gregaria]|nr:ubiquitin carboxyl-terminal hydrolase 21-like isoform X2 [Schistocerca gregaria]XP_049838753.1 ubiquitin carboxyl-terminal hydrolase 21-like isoform X2 [Schistocerca gregaria]XP_049838754.1 ubiquitin carboxyl-terminal hydrolase 21-like isoform X2 [Schistocerca gregaria]XP_049838755.1 ubiquitin carboxyl-terminal hydrolase 21-like isoform X2 [Schistocerca gregaria]